MEKSKFKKNVFYISVLCVITLFSMLMFSACIFTLATPENLKNIGGIVEWDSVEKASGYVLSISKGEDETLVETAKTSQNVSKYISKGTWKIKVKAKNNSAFWNDSDYSEAITIVDDGNFLAPDDLEFCTTSSKVSVAFSNVMHASSYTIKIVDPSNIELEPILVDEIEPRYNIDITDRLTDAGDYKISVKSNKINDDGTISSSDFTEPMIYTKKLALFAPEVAKVNSETGMYFSPDNTRFNYNMTYIGDNMIITLSTVANASEYVVSLYGSDEEFTSSTNVVTIPKSKLPKISSADKTAIQIVYAQVKSNSLYFNASDYSDGYIFYGENINDSNLENLDIINPYSNFVGTSQFDFRADSQDELNTMMYFALANRILNFKFYTNYATSSDYVSIATGSYYETKNLNTSYVTQGNQITIAVSYNTPGAPVDVATTGHDGLNWNKEQTTYNKLLNYSSLNKNSDKRFSVNETEILNNEKVALPILSRLSADKTLNVYTSDQLYLAVQAGYYPIFVGQSQAKQIWEKAIDVLVGTDLSLGIIDSTMTQEEMALAIFDWVCYNNKYDHNLYSRQGEEYSQKYRGFYLEGMFLDDGQAVCDGISKAYSLLCNMAGLNCIKVSGLGNGESHAWNKVGIYDSYAETYTYYMVDCTWNDITLSENNKETLVHRYFLICDDGKHQERNPSKLLVNEISAVSYDYFGNSEVSLNGTNYDLFIENDSISGFAGTFMEKLKVDLDAEYLSSGLNYLEIKIGSTYTGNFNSAVNTSLSSWSLYTLSSDINSTTYLLLHK